MRFYEKSKPVYNELEETPQKYVATDRIKHLFHSISNFLHFSNENFFVDLEEDKEKIGELKEIEQEEMYINILKEQRQKVFFILFFSFQNANF